MTVIPENLMGDFWPEVCPGSDGADYGTTAFFPQERFPVRSLQTFTLVYTVGEFGLDDTGAIKIVHRWTDDSGVVQFNDPTQPNYVTATASNGSSWSCMQSRTRTSAPGTMAFGLPSNAAT